ncbi:hypothetical protein OXB_2472 [Bacillus sp. OxB-1]|nr:hypothetical protein OXB_2472 [Bacillus sp. OxB-1]
MDNCINLPNGQRYLYSGASLFGKNKDRMVTEYLINIHATLVLLTIKTIVDERNRWTTKDAGINK